MKKLSLLIACLGIISTAAIAQDGSKVKKNQEPVRIVPMENTQKGESTPAAEKKAAPVSSETKATPVTPVKLARSKRIPVKATAKPAAVKAKAVEVK